MNSSALDVVPRQMQPGKTIFLMVRDAKQLIRGLSDDPVVIEVKFRKCEQSFLLLTPIGMRKSVSTFAFVKNEGKRLFSETTFHLFLHPYLLAFLILIIVCEWTHTKSVVSLGIAFTVSGVGLTANTPVDNIYKGD